MKPKNSKFHLRLPCEWQGLTGALEPPFGASQVYYQEVESETK